MIEAEVISVCANSPFGFEAFLGLFLSGLCDVSGRTIAVHGLVVPTKAGAEVSVEVGRYLLSDQLEAAQRCGGGSPFTMQHKELAESAGLFLQATDLATAISGVPMTASPASLIPSIRLSTSGAAAKPGVMFER